MFDFIRNHQRLTLGFILLLIIPSFVFFGIEGYSRFTGAGNETVAQIGRVKVTRAEWDQAHQRYVDRMRRQQPGVDVATLESAQARRETLDAIVRERTLLAAAADLHLTPTDARLQRLFVSDPQYAALRNPDGSVNRDLLATQGMNSQMLEQSLRQEYAMRQVIAGVEQSVFTPGTVANRALVSLLERREVQLQRFDPTAYRAKVNPTDADIEAYYKANESQFRAPEQAQIEYVQLDLEALGQGVQVSDDEARKFYEANAARYTAPEERRASHILVKADAGASADERAKAKAKAEQLLAEARKNPAAFAELAKKNSDDPGSAAQGGDLDFFARGAMVKPFEDATWALKPGEISNVVQSDFGYHVILLTSVRGGQRKPFEEVRAEIVAEVRKNQLARKWPEAAEQFTNTAYEQPDSLQPLMDKFKLARQTATVQRQAVAGSAGVLGSQKLLDAVFAVDAVKNKRNTDAVEVGPNQLVAARVVKHEPARTLALNEVKERVRERVIVAQAAALARSDAAARLAALQKAPGEALPQSVVLSRMQTLGAPRQVTEAVLRADPAKLPYLTSVDLGDAGTFLLRVTQVLPREVPPGAEDTLREQLSQTWAGAEAEAYLAALKKRYKSEVKPAAAAARAASAPT
jgi:peptidyl-prolyl cis-trans isomerase D